MLYIYSRFLLIIYFIYIVCICVSETPNLSRPHLSPLMTISLSQGLCFKLSKYFREKLSVFLSLLFPPYLPLSLSFYFLFCLSLIGVTSSFGEHKAFLGACSEVEIQARKKLAMCHTSQMAWG